MDRAMTDTEIDAHLVDARMFRLREFRKADRGQRIVDQVRELEAIQRRNETIAAHLARGIDPWETPRDWPALAQHQAD